MALENRDYMREPPTSARARAIPQRRVFARPRPGSVTSWLIFLNVFVFVMDPLLANWGFYHQAFRRGNTIYVVKFFEYWGCYSPLLAVKYGQFWRFITFQFLHANFDHLVFNVIALLLFGPMVELYLTSRQYLVFYLLSGAGGAAVFTIIRATGLTSGTELVGASAGIFGVLVAAAMIAPHAIVMVFGFFPMRIRAAAWGFIVYAVFQILFRGKNAGGEAAHVGGAIVGFLLMRFPGVLERIAWLGKRAPPF